MGRRGREVSGFIVISSEPPIVDVGIQVAPKLLLDKLKKARPMSSHGRGIASQGDMWDWLATTPNADDLILPPDVGDRFIDMVISNLHAAVDDKGEHRRQATRDAVFQVAIEAAAGCYPAESAYHAIRDAYRALRESRGEHGDRGWSEMRSRDYDVMWQSLIPAMRADDYADKVDTTREGVLERYPDGADDCDVEFMQDLIRSWAADGTAGSDSRSGPTADGEHNSTRVSAIQTSGTPSSEAIDRNSTEFETSATSATPQLDTSSAARDGGWHRPIPLVSAHSLPPFPVDAPPEVIAAQVRAVAEFTQTDPGMEGTSALSVLAACGGGRCQLEIRPGWREPGNLWTVTIAEPGERKSAVQEKMVAPLLDAEQELVTAAEKDVLEATVLRDIAMKAAEKAAKTAGNAESADRGGFCDFCDFCGHGRRGRGRTLDSENRRRRCDARGRRVPHGRTERPPRDHLRGRRDLRHPGGQVQRQRQLGHVPEGPRR